MSKSPTPAADRTHFDRIAKAYNSSLPSHVIAHYLDRRTALVQRVVPKPGPILDMGCGTGMLAWRLQELGYDVTGLDTSIGMLLEPPADQMTNRLLGDGTQLPVRDGAFAAVISVATLHHIADPDLVRSAIREAVRVTAPGGVTIIWDHNPLNPYWPMLMARVPQDEEDTRLVSLNEILDALKTSPNVRIDHTRCGWIPDFAPSWSLPVMSLLERGLESIPGIRTLSAHNVVLARKNT